ncbi:hypothetical protein [Salinigranum marinum]|uniref:hypothetical protein n=1 Tax=Salinigranum marinum TaxID=1515595 RepID=UPI00298A03EF|nr:hypothetical protein [Salinigranum marinum]
MYPSTPTDDATRQPARTPTWNGLAAAILALAAVPLALWAVSNPLAGVVLSACLGGVVVGARRTARRLAEADPGGEPGGTERSAPALGAWPAAASSRGRR